MRHRWVLSKTLVLAAAAIALCVVGLVAQFAWSPALALGTGVRRVQLRSYRDARFEGRIEAMSAAWWWISGHRVRVSSALTASDSNWQVGDWVAVKAERRRDGSLAAVGMGKLDTVGQDAAMTLPRAQAISSSLPVGAMVEFEGRVLQLPAGGGSGEWLVDDVRVIVGQGTKIDGVPTLGRDVEVSGTSDGDRQLLATEIVVVGSEQQSLLVQGLIIDSVAGTGTGELTLNARDEKGIVLPISLRIDEHTFFDESHGRAEADMWAEIRVVPVDDGTLWAQYVKVVRP